MVYVTFVIDEFAWKIVGWRVSTSMTTGFVLDAIKQAICQRCPENGSGLVHHSNRGSQYLSIKYTERLTEARIDPSVGSVGDSYDNAVAWWTSVVWGCFTLGYFGKERFGRIPSILVTMENNYQTNMSKDIIDNLKILVATRVYGKAQSRRVHGQVIPLQRHRWWPPFLIRGITRELTYRLFDRSGR